MEREVGSNIVLATVGGGMSYSKLLEILNFKKGSSYHGEKSEQRIHF